MYKTGMPSDGLTGTTGTLAASPPSAFSSVDLDLPRDDKVRVILLIVLYAWVIGNAGLMMYRQIKAKPSLARLPGGGKDMSLLPAELRKQYTDIAGLTTVGNVVATVIGLGLCITMTVMV